MISVVWNAAQAVAKTAIAQGRRFFLCVGGSRSGKTFLLVFVIIVRALREPNSKHVILRLHSNAAYATLWLETIPKVLRICFPELRVTPHIKDSYFEFPNGSQLWVGGLDDKERVEKILGHEFATILFNECSQIPYASILMALTRLAAKCVNIKTRAFFDINPPSKGHWTYKKFVLHVDPVTRNKLDPEQHGIAFINPRDNLDNIDPAYLSLLEGMPARQRQRFLDGVFSEEAAGQLWTLEGIDAATLGSLDRLPDFQRIVVAVDPSGTKGDPDSRSDNIGIVVAGLYRVGDVEHGMVLEDASGNFAPERWGAIACALYHKHGADCVVGESNYGGDMVRSTIHAADKNVPYKAVVATRGKVVRAEPISALYESKRVKHAMIFEEMNNQLCNFTTGGYAGEGSPDNADAAIWALTELLLTPRMDGMLEYYRREAAELQARKANGKS